MDPDLGKISPGHACKHGIRWPHACQPCDDAAWAARTSDDWQDHCGEPDCETCPPVSGIGDHL